MTGDGCPRSFGGDNLAAQLQAAGLTFTGYSEGLPAAGYTGCSSGRDARKHKPWVDFPALGPAAPRRLRRLGQHARQPAAGHLRQGRGHRDQPHPDRRGGRRRPAGTSSQRIDYYGVLRTVEDMSGLPPLGRAVVAPPLGGLGG